MTAPTQPTQPLLVPRSLARRAFVSAAAAPAGGLAVACADRTVGGPVLSAALTSRLREPESSGIEHVVLVMMENRSFDHFLGWLPHADGRQAGLSYADPSGTSHPTYSLAPDLQGCGHLDPDHSYAGGRVEYNAGACDGWLRVNDLYSIGYYQQQDLPFLGRAVPDWMSFDNYFCPILGPTFPNRFYQHAGQTDRLSNTLALATLPTIWDRLAAAGLGGRYYYGDLPFVALSCGWYDLASVYDRMGRSDSARAIASRPRTSDSASWMKSAATASGRSTTTAASSIYGRTPTPSSNRSCGTCGPAWHGSRASTDPPPPGPPIIAWGRVGLP
jgi:hypothetical protein